MEAKNEKLPIDITADKRFIQEVVDHLTISGRLPFTVPTSHIPLQIKNCAKHFYRKYSEASEISYYRILNSDIVRNGLNKAIMLPSYIIGVTDIQQVGGPAGGLSLSRRSPSLIMLNALKFNDFVNGTWSGSGFSMDRGAAYYSHSNNATDAVLSLYEQSVTNIPFTKGIRYNYNTNTNRLQILGEYTSDIVIEVHEGIELRYLYNDENFLKYVVGMCLKNLKAVLGSFAFNMPGAIGINYEEYEARGNEMIEEIKLMLEDDEPGDLFIIA